MVIFEDNKNIVDLALEEPIPNKIYVYDKSSGGRYKFDLKGRCLDDCPYAEEFKNWRIKYLDYFHDALWKYGTREEDKIVPFDGDPIY